MTEPASMRPQIPGLRSDVVAKTATDLGIRNQEELIRYLGGDGQQRFIDKYKQAESVSPVVSPQDSTPLEGPCQNCPLENWIRVEGYYENGEYAVGEAFIVRRLDGRIIASGRLPLEKPKEPVRIPLTADVSEAEVVFQASLPPGSRWPPEEKPIAPEEALLNPLPGESPDGYFQRLAASDAPPDKGLLRSLAEGTAATLKGVQSGLFMGLDDYVGAAVGSFLPLGSDEFLEYKKNLAWREQLSAQQAADYPILTAIGEGVGGGVPMLYSGGTSALGQAGMRTVGSAGRVTAANVARVVPARAAVERAAVARAVKKGAAKTTVAVKQIASRWKKKVVNGKRVYQRDDLIDPRRVDDTGMTNLDRMKQGLAPIGPDGKKINLHHMIQTNDGAIAEVTQSFHQQNKSIIHINPSSIPSGIDRPAFDRWRASYWKERAKDFLNP